MAKMNFGDSLVGRSTGKNGFSNESPHGSMHGEQRAICNVHAKLTASKKCNMQCKNQHYNCIWDKAETEFSRIS